VEEKYKVEMRWECLQTYTKILPKLEEIDEFFEDKEKKDAKGKVKREDAKYCKAFRACDDTGMDHWEYLFDCTDGVDGENFWVVLKDDVKKIGLEFCTDLGQCLVVCFLCKTGGNSCCSACTKSFDCCTHCLKSLKGLYKVKKGTKNIKEWLAKLQKKVPTIGKCLFQFTTNGFKSFLGLCKE